MRPFTYESNFIQLLPGETWNKTTSDKYKWTLNAHQDLHPGFSSVFVNLSPWHVKSHTKHVDNEIVRFPRFEDYVLEYHVFAENLQPKKGAVVFTEADFGSGEREIHKNQLMLDFDY